MKRLILLLVTVAVGMAPLGVAGAAGNGAPSGPHYNLNIIGVEQSKDADLSGTNGHSLFVDLQGSCRINLQEGDFSVVDRNCTDDKQALFQLPNPDPDNSGTTAYSVYARALGKPGGGSKTQTCFDDTATGETYCSIYQVILERTKGQQKFTNVSQELLYVYYCSDGKIVRVPLFDSDLHDFYWQYTNQGLRLAQLRFYPGVQTKVASAAQSC